MTALCEFEASRGESVAAFQRSSTQSESKRPLIRGQIATQGCTLNDITFSFLLCGCVMRFVRNALVATFSVCLLAGCSDGFASFGPGPITGHYTYNVPAAAVTRQIRCELAYFFNDPKFKNHRARLDRTKDAEVKLTLKTTTTGSVTYLGIDLDKIGFNRLADLIGLTKENNPALQAQIEGKSTVTAKVSFKVPLSINDYEKNCASVAPSEPSLRKLYLAEWLGNFYSNLDQTDPTLADVKIGEIALTTSFAVFVDVKAGALNPFFGSVYVLPISGLSGGFKPDYSHDLEIILNKSKEGSGGNTGNRGANLARPSSTRASG